MPDSIRPPDTRPSRGALTSALRDCTDWLLEAQRVCEHHGDPGRADSYADRASIVDDLVSREAAYVGRMTFGREDYLTTKEAAEYCGIPEKTWTAWREQGRGPVYYRENANGKRVARCLYLPEDLDRWLAATIQASNQKGAA